MKKLFNKYPTLSMLGTVVIFVLIQGIFSFCSKAKCPPFSTANFNDWFPYKLNDQKFFDGPQGNTDTLTFANINKQPAYTVTRGYGFRGCSASGNIQTLEKNQNGEFLFILSGYKQEEDSLYNVFIQVEKLRINLDAIGPTRLTPSPFAELTTEYYTAFQLNGKSYSNVQAFSYNTIGPEYSGIHKAWFSKGKGLIGYEHFPSGDRYTLR